MGSAKVVAIVDDDEAVRESTAALLRSADFEVQLFNSGDEFLTADLTNFAVILLDMRMPGADGIEVLRQLGERESCPPVVVLTGHGDVTLAVEAMKLGALDFLEKPYEPGHLMESLATAIGSRQPRGDNPAPSKEAMSLVGKLSARQLQVLCAMLEGKPNKIMAWNLGLSIRTVEAHRAQVMARLQVRSIAEALKIAYAAGLSSADQADAPIA